MPIIWPRILTGHTVRGSTPGTGFDELLNHCCGPSSGHQFIHSSLGAVSPLDVAIQLTVDEALLWLASKISVGTDASQGTQQRPVHWDADGDVLMADLPAPMGQANAEQQTVEATAMMMNAAGGEVHYQTETWTRRLYRDFVEELTGIARIDLEIR